MIAIVDYDAGNLKSVQNMLKYLGADSIIASEPSHLEKATKLILPGVGKFDFGMSNLEKRGLIQALNEKVLNQKIPILGICLGAQLLTRGSQEGVLPGLGWIPADTIAFDRSRMSSKERIPHMGWSDTEFNKNSKLFSGVTEVPRYYYVHSFHFKCDHPEQEICHANYGYRFASGIGRDNIVGVQFHPEKSHAFGKLLLRNFIERY